MLSAEQGNYWYHFYNVFGMTRSLTWDWTRDLPHSKPALVSLGFRGGSRQNLTLLFVLNLINSETVDSIQIKALLG